MNIDNTNTNAVCQIQNAMGRFIHYYCANDLDLVMPLIASTPDSVMELPALSKPLIGPVNIQAGLRQLQDGRAAADGTEFHLLHTPACTIADDGRAADASWETYSYCFQLENDAVRVQLYITRIDARFIVDQAGWKISRLSWKEMQSFLPWTEPGKINFQNRDIRPAPGINTSFSAEDWLDIRNIQGFYATNNRRDFAALFADDQEATFQFPTLIEGIFRGPEAIRGALAQLAEREADHDDKYLGAPLMTTPVIEIAAAGESAEGWWLAQTFEVTMTGQIIRRLGLFHQQFVKREGIWQIIHFRYEPKLQIPVESYEPARRYHRMQLNTDNWLYSDYPVNCGAPDDVFTIENIFSEWFGRLHTGALDLYVNDHMYNDEVPFRLDIRSRGKESPCLTTREQISGKLQGMDRLYVPKQTSHHAATTPVIKVSPDRLSATAIWLDHSLTNIGPADGQNGHLARYMILIGKYIHGFTRVNGEWKHTSLEWEPLLSLPDMFYEQSASRGWAGSDDPRPYPMPCSRAEFNQPTMLQALISASPSCKATIRSDSSLK